MEDLLSSIEQEDLTFQQKGETYETLRKVLGNITANPTEQKFRTLKKDNRLVADKICRSCGACSVILALGFDDDGAVYRCPPDADLAPITEILELIDGILASRGADEAAAPAAAAAAPVSTQEPARPIASPASSPSPLAKAAAGNFARRSDEDKKREEQARELEAVRAAQRAQFAEGGSTPAALRAAAPAAASPTAQADAGHPDAKKQPAKSAFDFKSRSKEEQQQQNAANSLEEIRKQQREKFKQFEADPDARKAAAYQQPASVAKGGKAEQGWGDWFGSMFGGGGGSSSGGGGGGGGANDRKPQMKTINDLPKPVKRG